MKVSQTCHCTSRFQLSLCWLMVFDSQKNSCMVKRIRSIVSCCRMIFWLLHDLNGVCTLNQNVTLDKNLFPTLPFLSLLES